MEHLATDPHFKLSARPASFDYEKILHRRRLDFITLSRFSALLLPLLVVCFVLGLSNGNIVLSIVPLGAYSLVSYFRYLLLIISFDAIMLDKLRYNVWLLSLIRGIVIPITLIMYILTIHLSLHVNWLAIILFTAIFLLFPLEYHRNWLNRKIA